MEQPTTPQSVAISDATAEQVTLFHAKLSARYAALTDRQLLELNTMYSQKAYDAMQTIADKVGPAMESLGKGGLMSTILGMKGK